MPSYSSHSGLDLFLEPKLAIFDEMTWAWVKKFIGENAFFSDKVNEILKNFKKPESNLEAEFQADEQNAQP